MEHVIWFEELGFGWVMDESVLAGVNDENTEQRSLDELLPKEKS